jgi:hypothetical protein
MINRLIVIIEIKSISNKKARITRTFYLQLAIDNLPSYIG